MKVVLSGASGFIGSHLAHCLTSAHEIIAFDRTTGQDMANITQVHDAVADADIVLHFAATAVGRGSLSETRDTRDVDYAGTRHFIDAAVHADVPLVYASSIRVYGTEDEIKGGEDIPIHPTSAYGTMKLRCEGLIRERAARGALRFTILRFAAVFGAGMPDSFVMSSLFRAILAGRPIALQSPGDSKRTFLHVDDAVRAVELLLDHSQYASNATFNIMHRETVTLRELASRIGLIAHKPVAIQAGDGRDDPSEDEVPIEKARAILGWEPQMSLDEGLRRLYQYYTTTLASSC